jgi:hypothetical protein
MMRTEEGRVLEVLFNANALASLSVIAIRLQETSFVVNIFVLRDIRRSKGDIPELSGKERHFCQLETRRDSC